MRENLDYAEKHICTLLKGLRCKFTDEQICSMLTQRKIRRMLEHLEKLDRMDKIDKGRDT